MTFMTAEGAPPSRWRLVGVRSNELQKQLKLERASHTATVANGAIYVIAGRKGSAFFGDVLRFDPDNHTWSVLFPSIPNGFRPRANHSATLVGRRHIWVLAGSDNEQVIGDVHVLDVATHTWTKPQLRGETSLLFRTAHSAELHPCDPRAILVFGGYDGSDFHNDLFVIRTDSLTVERVTPVSGGGGGGAGGYGGGGGGVPPPVPRGYHSCTAAGSRCYVYGGRTEAGVVDASEMLAVYDAAANRWVQPQVAGPWPQARSSHRAVALGNRLLVHGGAAAGEQDDRLADVHSLVICPATGRLAWSRVDEPPPAAGSASLARPQGRSAHTVSLVGSNSLYVICGYVGARSGPHRYSGDVYQMQLGLPATEPLPQLPPPQQQPHPSPRRSPPRQPQASPQHLPKQGSASPGGGTAVAQSAAAGGDENGALSTPTRPVSPLRQEAAAPAAAAGARPAKRRLLTRPNAIQAQPPTPRAAAATVAAVLTPDRNDTALGGGGAEDDPIDLTAEQPPTTTSTPTRGTAAAAMATVGAARRALPAARGRADIAVPAEGVWLGGGRRGRSDGGAGSGGMQQPLLETGAAPAPAGANGAVPATRVETPTRDRATGLHGHPLAAQAAPGGDAAEGRAAKRQASDAAVAAAAAAASRGRLPVVQGPPAVGEAGGGNGAAAAVVLPPPPRQQSGLAHGHGHAAMSWRAQTDVFGLAPGTIAAAATAAATAAVAATTAASSGGAHGALAGGVYHRPPSPPHVGPASNSQDVFLTQLLQHNQSLQRQLQEAQEAERQAAQKLAAQQEQQRRTAEEVLAQRRSCEMTQAELRSALDDLEDARVQADRLQQELVAARQQSTSLQQDLAAARQEAAELQRAAAAAAGQAVERERAALAERAALLQQREAEARKQQEQVTSLEAQCGRHQADLGRCRRELQAEAERHGEAAAALGERMAKREQDVAELTSQLREAAAHNQKLHQEQGRLQDAKQRLERDLSEAREQHQRLQRQMDEQVGELSRHRDTAQMQLTHANSRLAGLELELRRLKDEATHRELQHAALQQAHAERGTELAAAREQLRAAQQKQEVARQQAGLIASQLQAMQATAQALASGT